MRMHNPAHPGEILKEHMESVPVSRLAEHLGVSRVTLSRVLLTAPLEFRRRWLSGYLKHSVLRRGFG